VAWAVSALAAAFAASLPAHAQTAEDRRFCSDAAANVVF
jgi:hypothetical protein